MSVLGGSSGLWSGGVNGLKGDSSMVETRGTWPAATECQEAEDIARSTGQIPPPHHMVFHLRTGVGYGCALPLKAKHFSTRLPQRTLHRACERVEPLGETGVSDSCEVGSLSPAANLVEKL